MQRAIWMTATATAVAASAVTFTLTRRLQFHTNTPLSNTTTLSNATVYHSVFPMDGEGAMALVPDTFVPFRIVHRHEESHNVVRLRLALPGTAQVFGLPTSACVLVKVQDAAISAEPIVRPYTPCASSVPGHVDLIVKKYDTGKASLALWNAKVGSVIDMKGPLLKLPYTPNAYPGGILMLAGGSGLTPMLQVIDTSLADASDKNPLTLVFANRHEEDVFLKNELDARVQASQGRLRVLYVLSQPKSNALPSWAHGKGHIELPLIKSLLNKPTLPLKVLVCGPPGFMEHVSGPKNKDYTQGPVSGLLKEAGLTSEQVFKF